MQVGELISAADDTKSAPRLAIAIEPPIVVSLLLLLLITALIFIFVLVVARIATAASKVLHRIPLLLDADDLRSSTVSCSLYGGFVLGFVSLAESSRCAVSAGDAHVPRQIAYDVVAWRRVRVGLTLVVFGTICVPVPLVDFQICHLPRSTECAAAIEEYIPVDRRAIQTQ